MNNESRMIRFDQKLLTSIRDGHDKAKRILSKVSAKDFDEFGTLLHYAAHWGNYVIVFKLIQSGAEVDSIGQGGKTPLMLAVENHQLKCVKIMLEANASIDIVDARGKNVLQIVFSRDQFNSDIAKAFIHKLKMETLTEELGQRLITAGGSMFHAAVLRDDNLIRCLRKHEIDIKLKGSQTEEKKNHSKTRRAMKPIAIVFDQQLLSDIRYGRNEIKSMIDKNIIRGFDDFGTLLHYAARYKNELITRHLIELGSDIDFQGRDNKTPLILATQFRATVIIKILLEADANIDIVDANGQSALQLAFLSNIFQHDIVEAFLRKVQTRTRTTEELADKLIGAKCSMYNAVSLKEINLIKYMLEQKFDINSEDSRGRTALHRAAELNDLNLVKFLIKRGADINAFDFSGNNALLLSSLDGKKDVMQFLLAQGCNPNCKNRYDGRTPLLTIFENMKKISDREFSDCVELLLQHGAVLLRKNSTVVDRMVFDIALQWSNYKVIKILISHLALLKMHRIPITEPVINCNDGRHRSKILELENFYEQCKHILPFFVFKQLSLLKLLYESDRNMKLLLRKEMFIFEVEKFCMKYQLRYLYPYYYNILMKKISKANRSVELEDKAALVICKIFSGNYNECYVFAKKIIGYLNVFDLECLVRADLSLSYRYVFRKPTSLPIIKLVINA